MSRRWGLIVALALLAAAGLGVKVSRGAGFSYSGPAAPEFSFRYEGMKQVAPRGDELVRLEGRSRGLLVRRLTAEPVQLAGGGAGGDPVSTSLPFAARRFERRAARRYPEYRQAIEGRTRLRIVSGPAAYMLGFTARGPRSAPGGTWVGKTLLIAGRGDAPRHGVALELVERARGGKVLAALRRAPVGFLANWPIRFWVQQRTAVDAPTPLERAVSSFSLG